MKVELSRPPINWDRLTVRKRTVIEKHDAIHKTTSN